MPLTKETIRDTLAQLRTLGPAGAISKVAYCDGYASITLAVGRMPAEGREVLTREVIQAVKRAGTRAGEPVNEVHVEFTESSASKAPSAESRSPAPGHGHSAPGTHPARHIIAVGAGKGGVGKSTIAVNLAVGLARKGHAVGLLDADIYGPSIPTMLGLSSLEVVVMEGMLQPFAVHGIKTMTIGKLVDPEKPLIWRGPMAHGAFKQLVEQTQWGELDYLVIDLPPGTGDVSLTMSQVLRITGAVIVCTPQRVAQDDAVRAARMFQQLHIEVLGVVENMSCFVADDLDPPRTYDLFGQGGAESMAARLGLPFLGAVPITVALRQNSDRGDPTANFTGRPELAACLDALVTSVEKQTALAAIRSGSASPTLTVS